MDLIGIWSAHARSYALALTCATFFIFSLPIFLAPGRWAKTLLWRVPDDTDLAWYFARCLGSFALVTNLLFLRAAMDGTGLLTLMELFFVFSALMVIVHIWGALEGSQPITETLEIGLWLALCILTLLFMPAGA